VDSSTEDEQVKVISSFSKRGRKCKRAPTTFYTTKKGKQAKVAQNPVSVFDTPIYSHTSDINEDDSQHPTTSQDNPPVPSSFSSLPPTQPHSEDASYHE